MKGAFANIKKRPILLIFLLIIGAVVCFAEQFNAFTKQFGSLGKMFQYDYVTLLSEIANWIHSRATNPALMAVTVGIALLTAIAVGAIFGILYSGYSYTLYVTILDAEKKVAPRKQKKTAALFAEGINRRFGRMIGYFVFLILSAVLMFGLAAYSVMPAAISIQNVLNGDTGSIFTMVLLTAITALILFFAVMFYAMYMSFLLPGIIAFKKGSVRVALRMVNGYCWYLIPRTLAFLVYMAAVLLLMLAIGFGGASSAGRAGAFLLNWFLTSCGLFVYTHYVFSTYAAMKEDMFGN